MFCAVCLRELRDAYERAPLGRDDAMVVLCAPCATTPVEPGPAPSPRFARSEPTSGRAAAIREHRDRLTARGLCVNGEKHGPFVPGRRVCQACSDKSRAREQGRNR